MDETPPGRDELSPLLDAWARQDPGARDRLVPLVYAELRRLAQHYMKGERADHTLQPTALVNEVYMRLAEIDRMQWRDRAHFIGTAATLMRRVLVDHARCPRARQAWRQVVGHLVQRRRRRRPRPRDSMSWRSTMR